MYVSTSSSGIALPRNSRTASSDGTCGLLKPGAPRLLGPDPSDEAMVKSSVVAVTLSQ